MMYVTRRRDAEHEANASYFFTEMKSKMSQFDILKSYNKRYYLTHPWEVLFEIKRSIVWTWQRIFRGWDDRVIWSIDGYLSKMMPTWIAHLVVTKHGIPIEAFDYVKCTYDKRGNHDNDTFDRAKEYYNEQLKKIAIGFACSEKIINSDFLVYELFKEWESKNYENAAEWSLDTDSEYHKRRKEFKLFEKIEVESKALEEHRKEGFEILDKWWYSLWD